jgi:tetratricopeptide (TPR) repeat protein
MEPSNDKAVFKTETDPKGAFTAEVLSEGDYVVAPRKKEYSFWPAREIAKLGREPAALNFKAVKADIDKLRLTEDAQTDESLEAICPGQDIYLKLDFKAEEKPARINAFLVAREKEKERLIQLDQAYDLPDQKAAADFGDEGKPLQLKVPSAQNLGPLAPSYRLRVNFTDPKGNFYSAEGRNPIKIDINMCFRSRFQRGVALHQKEKLEEAGKSYAEALQFGKILQEAGHLPADMPKILFDTGLAEISLAIAKEAGEAKRLDSLAKAMSYFSAVLKTQKKDVDAMFLRGMAYHSSGDYEVAIKHYNEALSIDPDSTEVKKLRALAYVKTGLKENLSAAVDDFTDVITNDPSAQGLRKSRSAALKLGAEPSTKTDQSRVDIGSVPLPDMREGLKLSNRVRK